MRDNSNFVKLKCLNKIYEVYHYKDELCLFGYDGKVFYIKDNCNTNNSFSSLGSYLNEYELPKGILSGSKEANEYLAGSSPFIVLEIEIF